MSCSSGPVNTNTLANSALKIYPNPSDDLLYLEGLTAGATLLLMDINGRVLWQKHTISSNGNLTVSAFQQIPAGLYTLWVKTAAGLAVAHRVVKQ
ncbi:MAG: T9SS type A sorting domain-containing protein [Lewinella sp.]|uniref:T9SS type A sorting domain-containing protein n=1 Tax=Lewinella sp. TaxID=2004506 RepID=UPI003D6A3E63